MIIWCCYFHTGTMTRCDQCQRLYCCRDDLTEHMNTCSPERRRFSDNDLFKSRNKSLLPAAKLTVAAAGSAAVDKYDSSVYRRHTIESMLSKDEKLNTAERYVRSPPIGSKWCKLSKFLCIYKLTQQYLFIFTVFVSPFNEINKFMFLLNLFSSE